MSQRMKEITLKLNNDLRQNAFSCIPIGASALPSQRIRPQVGALPYRLHNGVLQFMLVTSARTARWIIPKGNIEPDLSPAESARKEAAEEAGVSGVIAPVSIGSYVNNRPGDKTRVVVFPLRVETVLPEDRWPEHNLRRREWCSVPDAITRVEEADLQTLMQAAEKLLA